MYNPIKWKQYARKQHIQLFVVCTEEEKQRAFDTFYRASGDCICSVCNLPYKEHPELQEVPTFHLLCNKQWVKL